MENNQIKIKELFFLTSTLLVIGLSCVLTNNYHNYNGPNLQNPKLFTRDSDQTTFPDIIWNLIKESQSNYFELEVEVFGYRIISEAVNPIDYDQEGLLLLKKAESGAYNIFLSLEYGDFLFKDISIRGSINFDSELNYVIIYSFDAPKKGFFMTLLFFKNKIQIDIAFDGGTNQMCYAGIYNEGYKDITPPYPHEFEHDLIQIDSNEIWDMSPGKLKEILKKNQQENIIVNNQKYLEEVTTLGFSYTKYGVVHEAFEFYITYPEDLPDDYWEPYTSINIGIYRYLPSEAQIKSDLQYYNKDYWRGQNIIIRNILAYQEISHGGPSWYITGGNTITPSEIEQLWYHYYDPSTAVEIDVYPWDTILIVDACDSYYDPDSGTTPTMAKAFVDYGAAAFVGSTIVVPEDSDDFMRAFWYDLSQNNYDVETATITLCDTYGQGWNLGDEWRIYGDQDATLP